MMKLKFLLCFAALLVACGSDLCDESDWNTSQGICVFTKNFPIDKNKLSNAINTTEDIVSVQHPYKYYKGRLRDSYDSVSISFTPELGEDRDGYTKYEYGLLQKDTYEIWSEYREDEYWTYFWIIPHEILHVYLIDVSDDARHKRGWHQDPSFTDTENESSIQLEVFQKLCDVYGTCK